MKRSAEPKAPKNRREILDLSPRNEKEVRGGAIRPSDIPIVKSSDRPSNG